MEFDALQRVRDDDSQGTLAPPGDGVAGSAEAELAGFPDGSDDESEEEHVQPLFDQDTEAASRHSQIIGASHHTCMVFPGNQDAGQTSRGRHCLHGISTICCPSSACLRAG